MTKHQEVAQKGIMNNGQPVPVVAFYSVQGGVGKSTLARKFAELVTIAPGQNGHQPNVLLVDLDTQAQGLTFRLARGLRRQHRTVHDVIAERRVFAPVAIDVTGAVSLASGKSQRHDKPQPRGQLFLMPAAPPEAMGLFEAIATIDKDELIELLRDMIQALVVQYDISCVVIDCAPNANPYTAAAAMLSNIPLLIGRNEATTYEQISVLPERFREWYSSFQPTKQRVIINAVASKERYGEQARQYSIFNYIPLISDVIYETEGLDCTECMRMLLFEEFMVEIIEQVFVGKNHLIPTKPDIVGKEWIDILEALEHCKDAPKVRLLWLLALLRWVGAVLVVSGIVLIVVHQFFDKLSTVLMNSGIAAAIVGIFLVIVGWYAQSERQRILTTAGELVLGGSEAIFKMVKEGASHRKKLDEMQKIAETIPEAKKR
jgi:cellulose biosynthesis protein BcsQ